VCVSKDYLKKVVLNVSPAVITVKLASHLAINVLPVKKIWYLNMITELVIAQFIIS